MRFFYTEVTFLNLTLPPAILPHEESNIQVDQALHRGTLNTFPSPVQLNRLTTDFLPLTSNLIIYIG